MTPFWNAMANLRLVEPTPDNSVPGECDENARLALAAEIEVIVARDVYGLTAAEVAHILDTFPIVERRERQRFGEYKTKRLVLAGMAEEGKTSQSQRSASRTRSPVDISAVADAAWRRPRIDHASESGAGLAAVLKQLSGPTASREVRLAALLTLEPRLLAPSLSSSEVVHWRRVIGAEAAPLPPGVVGFAPLIDAGWRAALTHLRATGRLIDDAKDDTWAPGPGLNDITTTGWPDGRAAFVVDAVRRLGIDAIVASLPEDVRRSVDVAA